MWTHDLVPAARDVDALEERWSRGAAASSGVQRRAGRRGGDPEGAAGRPVRRPSRGRGGELGGMARRLWRAAATGCSEEEEDTFLVFRFFFNRLTCGKMSTSAN